MYSSFAIIGTLLDKPTELTTQSGLKIATITIRLRDKGSSIIAVKAYKEMANVAMTMKQGEIVIATGAIRSREWTNKAGKTSHILELMAFRVQPLEDKKNIDDDDIPF